MCVGSQYKIEFTDVQWEEIASMAFDGFEPVPGEPLSRGQWIAIAHMALGKAQRIEEGHYGDGAEGEDDDDEHWADELREIASQILNEFKPGNGKI